MSNRPPFHYKIDKAPQVRGFAADSARPGDRVKVLVKSFVHSDQREFHEYVKQVFSVFVGNRFPREQTNALLVQIHSDGSADVHINDIDTRGKVKAKRDLARGEAFTRRDIADIAEVRFANITIQTTDAILYCFREGWKFGLFFDFSPLHGEGELDEDELSVELARYSKHLVFQDLYAILENQESFNELFEDGWFPFIALIGGDYEHLSQIYADPKREFLVSDFLDRYGSDELQGLTDRWWRIPLFAKKKGILMAGVRSYLSQTEEGYVACIKTLHSEIDGILRLSYFKDYGKKPNFAELKGYARDRARHAFISEDPLSFPDLFYKYLDEVIFRDFDLAAGDITLSRHTSLHGVAAPEQYTRERAFQAVLALDQMRYFMA